MFYCTKCVLPLIAATPVTMDERGVCSACRVADQRDKVDWPQRAGYFKDLLEEYRSKDGSNYDCIVPVSGGKDSYWQTHVITKIYGLKPLLVTYHGNNYLAVGERNLLRMREVFDVDHIIVRPSVSMLVKMNRLCFYMMGDMNWHAHSGIMTVPIQVAVRYKVPLLIWGEHGFMDLGGMYSYNDFVEFTAKTRLEHHLRGYDWYDMVAGGATAPEHLHGARRKVDRELVDAHGLRKQDMLWSMYPSDEEIDEVGVRGVYLSNYHRWEANEHGPLMEKLYGWEASPEPFDRTYRRMSNLDDMHENGIHDYLKYVKFGYGRGTDHACKDIRAGRMTRELGIEMVRKYDHVKPRDLQRWLGYVDMTEAEFDRACDTFRDPRVWSRGPDGTWTKENIWD
jgi:N-acetyl sugar amidotransferase